MRKLLIVTAVAAQILVLGWMAFEREWVVRTGQVVFLRTAPVDPQDPMRGDYVRLNYEIATVPKSLCRDGVATWFKPKDEIYNVKVRDRRVYAEIELDSEGVAELVTLSDEPPSDGLYLRGRAQAIHVSAIDVRFGVEAFFMQQGTAKEFEDEVRNEKAGVPLNMEVRVGANGLAVLQGYRWEPLGITLELDRPPAVTPATSGGRIPRPGLRGLTIRLKNHGSTPQAIVTGPVHQSFRLLPSNPRWQSAEEVPWRWVRDEAPAAQPRPNHIKLLQPGESHEVHVDLTKPEWFVQKVMTENAGEMGSPVSIETLTEDWSASFRMEYRPPDISQSVGLPHAELIRHTRLRSRTFNAAGSVD